MACGPRPQSPRLLPGRWRQPTPRSPRTGPCRRMRPCRRTRRSPRRVIARTRSRID